MRLSFGKAFIMDFKVNDVGNLVAEIKLNGDLKKNVIQILNGMMDIENKNYNKMLISNCISSDDGLIKIFFTKQPMSYILEKFFLWYLPRLIGVVLSYDQISRKLAGAYIDYDSCIITDRDLAKVKVELESFNETNWIPISYNWGRALVAEFGLEYFNRMLPENESVFAIMTFPDEDGCYKYYDFVVGKWFNYCLSATRLQFNNYLYTVDIFSKNIKSVNLKTLEKYLNEIVRGLKKINHEKLSELVLTLTKILNGGLVRHIYKAEFIIRDILDIANTEKIKIKERVLYLMNRFIANIESIKKNELNMMSIEIQLIARAIAARIQKKRYKSKSF